MEELFGGNGKTPQERYNLLDANAVDTEMVSYLRKFDAAEIEERSRDYILDATKYQKLEEEKKETVAQLTAELKILKKENKAKLKLLKDQGENVETLCFRIMEQETNMVGYYDADAVLIEERKMTGNEKRQYGLFSKDKMDRFTKKQASS